MEAAARRARAAINQIMAFGRRGGGPVGFGLALTDEVMPEMTGTCLAAELHRLRPDHPVDDARATLVRMASACWVFGVVYMLARFKIADLSPLLRGHAMRPNSRRRQECKRTRCAAFCALGHRWISWPRMAKGATG